MKRVVAVLAAAAAFAVGDSLAATPPSGSVSSASGTVSWSYGPVVAGTVVDTGVEDICPPGVCDNFDLTVSLPQPAATYYQTNTATLTLVLSWTSTVDSDLDLFAYAPNGAKYGPGSPDTTATGPNSETLPSPIRSTACGTCARSPRSFRCQSLPAAARR